MRYPTPQSTPWVYRPGIHDRIDPLVLQGVAITPGSRVAIIRGKNPPMFPTKVFVIIGDQHGNVQTVYKRALARPEQTDVVCDQACCRMI